MCHRDVQIFDISTHNLSGGAVGVPKAVGPLFQPLLFDGMTR
jgi:hypothetical protein